MRDNRLPLSITILAAMILALVSQVHNGEETQLFLTHRLSSEESAFIDWLGKYGKSYATKEEYKFRLEQFKRTLKEIAAHNQDGEHGSTVGLNSFSDYTMEEWRMMFGHIQVNNRSGGDQPFSVDDEFKDLEDLQVESERDWREVGAVTPVKHQGMCKSCWTFAAIGAIESDYAIKHAKLYNFSEQQVLDCVHSQYCQGCNGGHFAYAWMYALDHNLGVAFEKDYPYTGNGSEACKNSTPNVASIKGYNWVESNPTLLKKRIYYKPVAVAIEGENDRFRHYAGGVITKGCGTNVDHAVLAVGYGETPEGQQYFLVKNSWGTDWGEEGYARIAADQCGITLSAASVNVN